MKKRLILLTMLILFSVSFALAQLSISEPYDTYNFGDKIYITLDGIQGTSSGNLNVDLNCGNNTISLLKISARAFSPDEENKYSLTYKELTETDLEIENITKIKGTCHISANLGTSSAQTKNFEISNTISLTSSLDKSNYNPGETATLTIKATKFNTKPLNGFIELSNFTSTEKEIVDGVLVTQFKIPEDARAGTSKISIKAFDEINDEKMNSGSDTISITINQIAKEIYPTISKQAVSPEEEVTLGLKILDQTGNEISTTSTIRFVSPSGKVSEQEISTEEFLKKTFESSSEVGTWKIKSTYKEVTGENSFEILPYPKVDFELLNSVLIVKNIGNTEYNDTILVKINDELQEVAVQVGKGQIKKYNLEAPNGEYNIEVSDAKTNFKGLALLTGDAISISDVSKVATVFDYTYVVTFLIILVAVVGFILIMKYYSHKTIQVTGKTIAERIKEVPQKFHSKMPEKMRAGIAESLNYTNKSPISQSLDEKSYQEHDDSLKDFTAKKIIRAESGLTMKGEKHQSTVISIAIKNYDILSEETSKRLDETVRDIAKKRKGLIDNRGDYIVILFNPLTTKTFHNEIDAIHAAEEMKNELNAQNKKYAQKVNFGISVNTGEIIASMTNKKLQYINVDNTIPLAKKISDYANSQVILVSDGIRIKLLRELKTTKVTDVGKTAVFSVDRIVDTEANKDKLKDILKRM